MLSALAPARRRLVLAVAGLAAALLVALVTLVLHRAAGAGAPGEATAPVPQDRPGPVLLVPGYGGSVSELALLAAALRARGKDVTIVRVPDNGLGDLRDQARAVGAAATTARSPHRRPLGRRGRLLRRRGGRPLLGAASSTARAGPAPGHARLAAPRHRGRRARHAASPARAPSPAAAAPHQPAAAPSSTRTDTAGGPPVVSIWTTLDDVVLPPDSARLAGALNLTVQGVCAGSQVRHGGLPGDPVVQGMVSAELGAGPTRTLGVADCDRLTR